MYCTMNLLATKNGGNHSCYRIYNDHSKISHTIMVIIITLKVGQKSVVINRHNISNSNWTERSTIARNRNRASNVKIG